MQPHAKQPLINCRVRQVQHIATAGMGHSVQAVNPGAVAQDGFQETHAMQDCQPDGLYADASSDRLQLVIWQPLMDRHLVTLLGEEQSSCGASLQVSQSASHVEDLPPVHDTQATYRANSDDTNPETYSAFRQQRSHRPRCAMTHDVQLQALLDVMSRWSAMQNFELEHCPRYSVHRNQVHSSRDGCGVSGKPQG